MITKCLKFMPCKSRSVKSRKIWDAYNWARMIDNAIKTSILLPSAGTVCEQEPSLEITVGDGKVGAHSASQSTRGHCPPPSAPTPCSIPGFPPGQEARWQMQFTDSRSGGFSPSLSYFALRIRRLLFNTSVNFLKFLTVLLMSLMFLNKGGGRGLWGPLDLHDNPIGGFIVSFNRGNRISENIICPSSGGQ